MVKDGDGQFGAPTCEAKQYVPNPPFRYGFRRHKSKPLGKEKRFNVSLWHAAYKQLLK